MKASQIHTKQPLCRLGRTAGWGLVLAVSVALSLSAAEGAGLLVADGGLGGVLEVEQHDVAVTIDNGIAVTTVTQVFRNTEDRQVEALYTFPVPKGASVADFSMWINGREMTGEVVEKERARQIYESYKQRRIDPGLLEQVDYKTFEMRIFPIAAKATQRVRIVYYQELDFDRDWATYVYPLATSTGRTIDSRTTGRFSFSLEVLSEVPIVKLLSPSHGDALATALHTPKHVQASLEQAAGDLGRDIVIAYELERPMTGVDLVASKQQAEDGYVMLTLTAGDELSKSDQGMDYVFVLDVSGSMDQEGKLGLSRGSIDAFVRSLGAEDQFDLMAFNVAPTYLFRSLRPADAKTVEQAAAFLARQRARGGTSLEPALRAAYRYKRDDRQLNVVILSDGMTGQQERRTLLALIGQRPAATRVFAVGVGNAVNRPLLEQITRDAGGLAAFISRGGDFKRQAAAFRRKLLRPALTNLRVTASGGELFDVEPRRLPSLFHGMPVRLYGRYKQAGPLTLKIEGDVGGERYAQTVTLRLPGAEATHPEIERMWAWHRIERLQQTAARTGAADDVRNEVVRLGEAYSIVTPYTSFLVLENDAEFKRWKIERRNVLRLRRDRASQERVRQQLRTLRQTAAVRLGPIEAASQVAAKDAKPGASANRRAPAPGGSPAPAQQPRSAPEASDGGGFGGGAIDPLGVLLALALAGLVLVARRRRLAESA